MTAFCPQGLRSSGEDGWAFKPHQDFIPGTTAEAACMGQPSHSCPSPSTWAGTQQYNRRCRGGGQRHSSLAGQEGWAGGHLANRTTWCRGQVREGLANSGGGVTLTDRHGGRKSGCVHVMRVPSATPVTLLGQWTHARPVFMAFGRRFTHDLFTALPQHRRSCAQVDGQEKGWVLDPRLPGQNLGPS